MIMGDCNSLLDACEFVLQLQGEPQSGFWLASQVMEMKLWRASEADVSDAIRNDIGARRETSRFIELPDGDFALRSWENTPTPRRPWTRGGTAWRLL
jgi:hypothetical protein